MSAISFGGVSLTNFLVTVRDYLKFLCNPSWVDKTLNRVRETAIIESGTVTTVTGVTNFDSYQARVSVIGNNIAAWALACRARIT